MSKLDDVICDVAYILDTLIAYRGVVECGHCNACAIKNSCMYAPKLGQPIRYNCPFYEERKIEKND